MIELEKSSKTKIESIIVIIILLIANFIQIWMLSLGQVRILNFRCDARKVGNKRYQVDVFEEVNFIFDIEDYGEKYVIMGDGVTLFNITGSTFSYSYEVEGIYNVTLWALGFNGYDSDWLILEVENDAPDFDIGYTSVDYHNATYDFENENIGEPPSDWTVYNNDGGYFLDDETNLYPGITLGGGIENLTIEDQSTWKIQSEWTGGSYRYVDIYLHFDEYSNHQLTAGEYRLYLSANDSLIFFGYNPELGENEVLFVGNYSNGQIITIPYASSLELFTSYFIGDYPDPNVIEIDWFKLEKADVGVELIYDEHDYGKIVNLDFGGINTYCGFYQGFSTQLHGTIEFWYRTSNTLLGGRLDTNLQDLGIIQKDNTWLVGTTDICNPLVGNPVPRPLNNTWHHIRIDWNNDLPLYEDLGLGDYRIYIDNNASIDFIIVESTGVNTFDFKTYGEMSIDAIGYTWDLGYELGENIYTVYPENLYEDIEIRFSAVNLDESEIDQEGFSFNSEKEVNANFSYIWDFGDGNYSYDESPSHTFYNEGEYPVRLTLIDDQGAMSTKVKNFIIKNRAPEASIKYGLNFDASYDFKFDVSNQPPSDWYTHGNVKVIDYKDEFSKVVEVNTLSGGYGMIRIPKYDIGYNGSIEFWVYFEDIDNDEFFFWIDKQDFEEENVFALKRSTRFGFLNGKWMSYYTYKGPSNEDRYAYKVISELGVPTNNEWIHIQFDYCWSDQITYRGLSNKQWRLYVNGIASDIYDGVGDIFNRKGFDVRAGSHIFFDSIGFTTDPEYSLGDNNPPRVETYYGTWDFRYYSNGPIPYDNVLKSTVLGPWIFGSNNFEKIAGSCSANILPELDGHNKVLELRDNNNTDLVFASLLDLSESTFGTIEFWLRTDDTSQGLAMAFGHEIFYTGIWVGNDGKWWYKSDSDYYEISDVPVMQNNTWHHIRLDFDCRENGGYLGLGENQFHFWVDGNFSNLGPFEFNDPVNNFAWNIWSTLQEGYDYSIFLDAVSVSWDPAYEIGDNTQPRESINSDTEIIFSADSFDTIDDQNNLRYIWNFGDNQSAIGQTILHKFTRSGKYKIRLLTVDDNGLYDVSETYIWIDNMYPSIDIIEINYGYATYDFTYDNEGDFPNGWYMSILEGIYGNSTIVIDHVGAFDKVVRIGNGTGFGGIWTSDVDGIPFNETEPGDLSLTSGTIEFWIYTNDTSEVDFYISLFEDSYLDGIFLEFHNGIWSHGGEQISFENLWTLQNNTWSHFRIDFCCDDSNYQGLSNDTFILYGDGYASNLFTFLHDNHPDISNITCFGIFTLMENNVTGTVYVDKFGFSSDPHYTIGDNKFDYVQYQFNEGETIILECMSYDTITDYQQLVYIWGDLYTNIGDWEDFGWYFSYLFPDNDDGDELEGYPVVAFVGDPLYMWDLDSYYIEVNNVLPTLNIHSAKALANISLSIFNDGPESANFSIYLSSDSINKTLFQAYFPENSQENEIHFNSTLVTMDLSEDWVVVVNQTARTGGEHLVELTFEYENGYQVIESNLFDGMQDIWSFGVNDMWVNQIDSLSFIPITLEASISDPSNDLINLVIDYNFEVLYEVDINTQIYDKKFTVPHQSKDIECFLQIFEELGSKYALVQLKEKIPDDWRIDLLTGSFPISYDFDFNLDMTDIDIFDYINDLFLSEDISVIGYINSTHQVEAYYNELNPNGPIQYDTVEFDISSFINFKNLAPSIEIHAPVNVTEDQEVFYYAVVKDFNNDQVNVTIAFGINNGNGMVYYDAINIGNNYYGLNYTYTNGGKYLIYINATDGTKQSRAIKLIGVENVAPYAKIRAFKNQTHEDEYITFSANFYDTPSDIDSLRFYWDFGDGVYSPEEAPSHAFHEAGDYQIRLCVKDNNGAQFWASYNLTVIEQPPEIIGPFALQGYEGQSITLDVEAYDSLNDYLLEYDWEIYEAKRIHNATYNFIEFSSGELPNYPGFEYHSENFISYQVVDDVSTHYKVLELFDNNDLSSGYWKLRYGNSESSSGTVEFWLRVSDLSSVDEKFEISLIESSSGTLPILISDNGTTWLYKNLYTDTEEVIANLPKFQSNFWHHIRIDYECTNGNYSGLGEDQWRIIVDGITSPELTFQFGPSPNDEVLYLDTLQVKSGVSSKGSIFCDAIGYSGGSDNYHIGDNLNTFIQSYDFVKNVQGKNPSVALNEGTYLINLNVQNDLSTQAEIILEVLNTAPTLTVSNKRYYGGTGEVEITAYALDSYIDSETLEFDWYLEGENIFSEFGTLSSSYIFNCESTQTLRGSVKVRDPMDQFSTSDFMVDIHMDSNGDGFSNEFEVFNGLTSVDVDEDGVPNYYEDTQLETNMWKWDTDDDLLSDGYNSYKYSGELSIGTDPLDNDTDDDLLLDGFEWFGWQYTIYTHDGSKIVNYTSNPLVKDSDNDLVDDYDEYIHKTNPLEPDTDKDGLTDYQEIFIYGSDPTNPDCDNDGLLDGIEFKIGTLYDNSDTDGDTILDGLEYYGWDFTSDPLLKDTDNDFLPDNEEKIQYTYSIGGRKNVDNPVILKFEEEHIDEAESAAISFLLAYGEQASNISLTDFRVTIYKRDSELILYSRWIRMYQSERYYSEVVDIKNRIERAGQSYYGDYVFKVSFINKNHAPLCLEEFSINVERFLEPNIADFDNDGLLDGVETKLIVEGTEEIQYSDVVNLTTDINSTTYDTYEIEISDIGYVNDADIYFTIESNSTLVGKGNVTVVVIQEELDIRIPDLRIYSSNFSFSAGGIFEHNYHIKPNNSFPYDFDGKFIILIDIYDDSNLDVFSLLNLYVSTLGYRKATSSDTEAWITKPDTPDSDNDGWSDKYEIFDRSKPTNPLAADTDGDGIIDSKDMNPHYNLMLRVDFLKGHIDELPWWYWGQKTRPDLQMSVEYFKMITTSYFYRYLKGESYVTPQSEADQDPHSGLDTLGVTYWRTASFDKKIFIDIEDDRKSFTFVFGLWDEGIGDPDQLWDTLRMQASYTYDIEDKNENGDYYNSGHYQGYQYHSKNDWLSFKITTLGITRSNTIAIYDNTTIFNGHYNDHYRMHVFELTITDIPLGPFTPGINIILIPNKFFVNTQLNALMQNETAFENSFISQGNYLSLKRDDLPDTASNNIETLFSISCTAAQAQEFLILATYGLIDESTGKSGIINSYSSSIFDLYPVEMMNIHKDVLTVIPQITSHGKSDDPGSTPEDFFHYCGNLAKQILEAIEGILSGDWEPAKKLWEKLKGAGIALFKAAILIVGGPVAILAFKAASFLAHYIVLGIIIAVVSKALFELSVAYYLLSLFSGGTVTVHYYGNRLIISPLFEMGYELDSEWVDYFSMEMTTLRLYFESPDWRYEFIFKYINITTQFTKSPDIEWIDTVEKFIDVFNTIGKTMNMAGVTFAAMGAAVTAAEATEGLSLIGGVAVLVYKLVKFYLDMVKEIEEKGSHINLGLGIGFFICAFAAFLPKIVTKLGTSLSSTASTPEQLKDLLKPHKDTAKQIGKDLKLLEYENVLNFDNQTRLVISTIQNLVGGTLSLVIGCATLTILDKTWVTVARFALGALYVYFGVVNFNEFFT